MREKQSLNLIVNPVRNFLKINLKFSYSRFVRAVISNGVDNIVS